MSNPSRTESANASRFAWANGLQNIGDELASAKTVLPWLFTIAGVPHFFTALLVPFREAGSMLPQAALTPWVTTHSARTRLWILGSLGQAAAAAVLALAAATTTSWVLGVIAIACLVFLSLCRALCSIAGKDVQGRTISKGKRGLVTGRAAQIGGAATLLTGLVLALIGELPRWGSAVLIAVGAAAWLCAAGVFRGIVEPTVESGRARDVDKHWLRDTWRLYRGEKDFRAFVNVRALLLVTALSTSFIVSLSASLGQELLTGLAGFVLASGLAGLVGGRLSGLLSDRSSKTVMAAGSLLASIILALLVAASFWAPGWINAWLMPVGFFAVALCHTGIRVARKTYVVDMAGGDRRTQYVGAANTMMGVILLFLGAVSACIALAGPRAALLFLAVMGIFGSWRAQALREVSAPRP